MHKQNREFHKIFGIRVYIFMKKLARTIQVILR